VFFYVLVACALGVGRVGSGDVSAWARKNVVGT
jgi:hypothetical protein